MEKENRNKLIRIISASVLLAGSVLVERTMNLLIWQLLLVYLVPYLVAGYEVLTEAAEDIAHGKGMDEDFLMAIATLGALCIGFMPGQNHSSLKRCLLCSSFKWANSLKVLPRVEVVRVSLS